MKEKVKIGFVPAHRAFFSQEWAIEMRRRVLEALQERDELEVVVPDEALTKNGLIQDDEDARKVVKLFKDEEVAGILIGAMTFGDETSAVSIAERMPGTPVALFSTKEGPFTEEGSRRSDAFCGTLSISSALYRRGIPFTFLGNLFPEEEAFSQGIRDFTRACAAVWGFKGARIGLVGPRPAEFETCAINEIPLIKQFAQRVIQISLADIFSSAEKLKDEEVNQTVKEIKARANCQEVSEESLRKMARLEITLRNFAQERNLDGMGIQCWTAMQEVYGISPCSAMGRLTDQGIMASCEVDIHGALTMLVQYLASLKERVPHFIDWTIQHQSRQNTFLAFHCGNAPPSLAAKGSQIHLRSHSILSLTLGRERSQGTAEFQLRPGPVTLSRIVEYDGQFKMLIARGKIIPSQDKLRGSWSWVEVPDLTKLYRTLAEEGFIHHASLIHGDISSPLAQFCKFTGMKAVVL